MFLWSMWFGITIHTVFTWEYVLMKYLPGICLIAALGLCSGCGALSATTLRCGTDGESSYVEVASAPQSIAANTRALSTLCAFAYEGKDAD